MVAVGISRFASMMDGLKRRNLDDTAFRPIVQRDLESGQHRNPDVQTRPEAEAPPHRSLRRPDPSDAVLARWDAAR